MYNSKKISRPPQARKHCRNGGPDTDGNWDKAQKKRERQEGKEGKEGKEDKERRMTTMKRFNMMNLQGK